MKNYKLIKDTIILLMAGTLVMLSACTTTQDSEGLFFLAEQETISETKEEQNYNTEGQAFGEGPADSVQKMAIVHICGEVVLPGVYEVPADARIYDVVQLAGGFTQDAAKEYLNLALPITDGMQIIILSEEEAVAETEQQKRKAEGLVNINTASVEELCNLPGIGESRANDIIAYRNANGGFVSAEDIMQVSGIKGAIYEKIKDKICVR